MVISALVKYLTTAMSKLEKKNKKKKKKERKRCAPPIWKALYDFWSRRLMGKFLIEWTRKTRKKHRQELFIWGLGFRYHLKICIFYIVILTCIMLLPLNRKVMNLWQRLVDAVTEDIWCKLLGICCVGLLCKINLSIYCVIWFFNFGWTSFLRLVCVIVPG